MEKKSILIASPIRKSSNIVDCFLKSLERLDDTSLEISYCFIDDNEEENISLMVKKFLEKHKGCMLEIEDTYQNQEWEKGEHQWSPRKIAKVIRFKNKIIDYFLDGQWDYLFFVDADLVLHKQTLQVLLNAGKDIISNIFWTQWEVNQRALPQVWLKDFYTLYDAHMLRKISQEEQIKEEELFLETLRKPGVYRVGGLGACTLIVRKVLERGVHFGDIYNLSFWGEDRSFCIRAVALGFELYVDTHYPAYHIFREEELQGAYDYLEMNKEDEYSKIKHCIKQGIYALEAHQSMDKWKMFFYEGSIPAIQEVLNNSAKEESILGIQIEQIVQTKYGIQGKVKMDKVNKQGKKYSNNYEIDCIKIKEQWKILSYKKVGDYVTE